MSRVFISRTRVRFAAVENICLGGAGMTGFDEHLFHEILHVFHVGRVAAFGLEHVEHLIGEVAGHGAIGAALSLRRSEDRLIYLGDVKGDHSRIAFFDEANHNLCNLCIPCEAWGILERPGKDAATRLLWQLRGYKDKNTRDSCLAAHVFSMRGARVKRHVYRPEKKSLACRGEWVKHRSEKN